MPMLKIQTNVAVAPEAADAVIAEASRTLAAELGKPERYVMVSLEAQARMMFGGSPAPLAYLELKSIGLPQARTGALSQALCDLLTRSLGIPGDRVYIEFAGAEGRMWGWNGSTF
ncbi:MAG: phenylpyruvate tautomerase MIF-related protein [Alphaproteobacteria bacterium]